MNKVEHGLLTVGVAIIIGVAGIFYGADTCYKNTVPVPYERDLNGDGRKDLIIRRGDDNKRNPKIFLRQENGSLKSLDDIEKEDIQAKREEVSKIRDAAKED